MSRTTEQLLLFVTFLFCAFGLGVSCDLSPTRRVSCKELSNATAEVKRYCHGTMWGNMASVGVDSPMAQELPRDKYAVVAYFQRAFLRLEAMARQRRVDNHMWSACGAQFVGDGGTTREEFVEQRAWLFAAIHFFRRAGPPLPNQSCFTRLLLDQRLSSELHAQMAAYHDGLDQMARKLLSNARRARQRGRQNAIQKAMECWKDAVVAMYEEVETDSFRCMVRHMIGIRNDGVYSLGAVLTNAPVIESMPRKERHFIGEDLQLSGDGTVLGAYRRPAYKFDNITHIFNDTTTLLSTWGGATTLSSFFDLPTARGPVVRYIEHLKSLEVESLQDGTFPSNVALLVLPALIAAFTPVTIFEKSWAVGKVLLYTLMVDIVAVLPLGIKGGEILLQGRQNHVRCLAYAGGVEDLSTSATIELWCASCSFRDSAYTYGVSFLVASVALIALGVVVELIAYKIVLGRMNKKEGHRKRWWRRTAVDEHWTIITCSRCTHCGMQGGGMRGCGHMI